MQEEPGNEATIYTCIHVRVHVHVHGVYGLHPITCVVTNSQSFSQDP